MKELSIEQKAKAYDEALERMRDFLKDWEDCGAVGTAMEKAKAVFPELAEPDDEKIRKAIIEHFAGLHSSMYPYKGFTKKQILAWLEKQGEQKPKFKVGDWIVCCNYEPEQIIGIRTNAYEMSNGDIRPFYMIDNNHNIRLWAIQDAKYGDVLYASPTESSKAFIFIFDHIDALGFIKACYKYDSEYGLKEDKHLFIGSVRGKYLPATKEQCDILLQKMKEAGKKIYNIHTE